MCYDGLLSRATDLLLARLLMSRRPAALLTSPRSIPDSSLFCTFCTVLQKSEAHPLPLQSLPASLQKPRECRQERFFDLATRHSPLPPSSSLFCTKAKAIPFLFNPLRTLCVFTRDATRTVFRSRHSPLATSARNAFRINTYKSVSKQRTLTTFRMNTYANSGGRAGLPLLRFLFAAGGAFFRLVFRFAPPGSRVVFLHGFRQHFGLPAEILLVHHSVRANHEGHHPGRPVLRRIRHKSESLGHLAVDDETLRPTRATLPRQDAVVVAAVRRRSSVLRLGIAFRNRGRHQRPDRALRLAITRLPIQPIALPLIAENFLRVLVVLRAVVFLFRRHHLPANVNRGHFIPSHAPVQNLFFARVGVEIPLAPAAHQRYRRRPIFRADIQDRGSIRLFHQPVHFLVSPHKVGAVFGVFRLVSRRNDFLPIRPQDRQHRFLVVALRRRHQRLARFVGRGKRLLPSLLRHRTRRQARRQHRGCRGPFTNIRPMNSAEVHLRSPHIAISLFENFTLYSSTAKLRYPLPSSAAHRRRAIRRLRRVLHLRLPARRRRSLCFPATNNPSPARPGRTR